VVQLDFLRLLRRKGKCSSTILLPPLPSGIQPKTWVEQEVTHEIVVVISGSFTAKTPVGN